MTNPIRTDSAPAGPRGSVPRKPMLAQRAEASSDRPAAPDREVERMPVQPKLLNLSMYINEHLREELTLEVLAARMNLSPFHFHRKFRAYFGESLHQHIKRLRLERSAHALLYQLAPVSQVARKSGYKTLSAFSHAFSAHFGVAPTRFREIMLMGRLAGLGAGLREQLGSDWIEHLAPSRIETLPEKSLVFLRADLKSIDDWAAACTAVARLDTLTGSSGRIILASVDLFGILTSGPFRIEVGHEAAELEPALTSQLGADTLSAGRYAVFEFDGPGELLAPVVRAIYHFWVPRGGERTLQSAHYITCVDALGPASRQWRIHVPLEDAPGAVPG